MKIIPYGKQCIDQADIDAVTEVLKSDYLTTGPKIKEFEDALCSYTGASYCVAVANGTAALHIAAAGLEIEESCEGITSPITFTATSNCLLYNGLKPVFADIRPDTYCIDPIKLSEKITAKTKVLLPVHFAGQPAEMIRIKEIADKKKLYVIEDAAHAIGSVYEDGSRVGSCKFSDMTIFSFHPVKTITTGEGGAITTNSVELYQKLLLLRSHGITRDPKLLKENHGPWYYEMQGLGYNYRMTDFQAALGINQLKKLDSFKERRRLIVNEYNKAFTGKKNIRIPFERQGVDTCFHLYAPRISFKDTKSGSRKEFVRQLMEKGVGTQVHYIPVHLQPYYKELFGFKPGAYPEAEKYYEETLSLPLFPAMTDSDIKRVIEAVISLL
jgi:UDP-4-amino-4,6-dideoxy-N-acetyl-beta-L-altrosamine transaminase